ncbi:MAG: sensor histidine kinase [Pseudomonadota bacterium]
MTRWMLGLWAWLLMAHIALAMTVSSADQTINLLPAVVYLEDPESRLQIKDVLRAPQKARFQPWIGHGSAVNFGLTESSYWLRFSLQRASASPEKWYLEVPNSLLGKLTLYTPDGMAVSTGTDRPLRERPSFNRHFVFPIELTDKAQNFYLHVNSSNALSVPLQLWQPYAYQQHLHWQLLLQFVYFGCILTLLLYNTMLSGLLKDSRFLLYALYSLAMGLGMFSGNGFGGLYLWPDQHPFDAIAQSAFLCLSIIFATEFARRLLSISTRMPKLDLWLQGSTILSCLVLVGLLMHLWHPMPLALVIQAFMVISLQMGILILYISVKQAIAHHGSARYFAIGWSILWIGAVVASLHAIGVVPSNGLTAYALQISTVGEMFFLAISLASKVREERGQLEQARQQTQEAQTELVEVLRTSEQKLEQTVQQRTTQLEQSLEREREVLQQYVRFGSMISHEVRNPIHIIQSQISLWHKEKSVGLDHTENRLSTMSSALQRLTGLFEKWLQSDRLKSPHLQMNLQTLEVNTWLESWLPAYQSQLTEHQLAWHPGQSHDAVRIDPVLLEMAITNLLENAAKYSQTGSTITVSVPPCQSTQVAICIDDEGQGIPLEFQHQVFEDFFRAQPESNKPGIGLGLSIVQRIVQLHGGRVEVKPASSGKGSRFFIWLPRDLA